MSHHPPTTPHRPTTECPPFELPPQDPAAEWGVLGAILRDNRLLDLLGDRVGAEDFYFHAHRETFAAIVGLVADGATADLASVFRATRPGPAKADITAAFLADVWDADPSGANAERNAGIVRDRAAARRLIHLCQEMTRAAYRGELAARFEADVFRVADSSEVAGPTPLTVAIDETLREIDRRCQGGPPRYLPTGLPALDSVIGGLHGGQLTILAGRPSSGKSALALHFAMRAAEQGCGALLFTMEMRAAEWAQRALAAGCSVPLNQLTGSSPFDDPTAERLVRGAAGCRVPVWLDDRGSHTAETIAAVARRAVRRHRVRLVVVDYLGLIHHGGRPSDNQATLVAHTTRRLKQLALQLDVPVVCLAQLNRDVEKRSAGKPQLSDLWDSGAVEQDADNVLMLWPEPVADPENPPEEQTIRVCVEKQRSGPRGVVPLAYVRRFVRFEPQTPGY